MDWYSLAKMDYEMNENPERLHDYVEYGKITQEQYDTIIKEG